MNIHDSRCVNKLAIGFHATPNNAAGRNAVAVHSVAFEGFIWYFPPFYIKHLVFTSHMERKRQYIIEGYIVL